jgi:hypothetical protein
MRQAHKPIVGRLAKQGTAVAIVAVSAVALHISGFGTSTDTFLKRGFERALQQDSTRRVWAAQPTEQLYQPAAFKDGRRGLLKWSDGKAPAFWPQHVRAGDRFTMSGPGGRAETLEVDDVQVLNASAKAGQLRPRLMVVTARVIGRIAAPIRFIVEAAKPANAKLPESL